MKIIHNAAYFLNRREQGRLLNDDDRVAAMEFVCELTEKLSSCKMLDVSVSKISEECAIYSAKERFFEKIYFYARMFLLFPQLPGGMGIVAAKN